MAHKKPTQKKGGKDNLFVAAILASIITVCYVTVVGPAIGKNNESVVAAPAGETSKPAAPPVVSDYDPSTKEWVYTFAAHPNGALSARDWQFTVGTEVADYHHELQTYTADASNIHIEDGVLVLDAHKEARDGRQYTSARVSTLGNFSFTYGTLEVEMMLPKGKGTWPAAWLLPRNSIYKPEAFGIAKNDPLSWALNGEIDFAEAIGSLPGQNLPAMHSYNELHRQPTYTPAFVKNPYTQFHKYGVVKTPTSITFTVDGVPYATRTKTADSPLEWPFDQPYYLILNLAVGGDWAGAQGIDDASAPWLLKVKSVSYKPL
jgi:beta-glucanase (GH16 family)